MSFSSPNPTAHSANFHPASRMGSSVAVIEQPDAQLLDQAFRLIPDVVNVYDVETGQVIYSNRPLASVLGYVDSLTHDDYLLHPDDQSAVDEQFQHTLALEDGEYSNLEYRLKDASGNWQWFSERQVIFKRHMDGSPAQILKTVRRSDDLNAAAAEQARVQRITRFINGLSHDLRTPLTVIKTSFYLMRKTNDPAKQEDRLKFIELQTAQLGRLVEQTSQLMHIEQDMGRGDSQPVSLDKLLAKLKSDYATQVEQKDLALEMMVADNLPCIDGDPEFLFVALQNVFENAINYTDSGCIIVKTEMLNGELMLTIEDTGIGIDPEDLPHILEPFYKIESSKRRDAIAAGLGLTITQRVVELTGGRIEVESQLGSGSTFRLIWPVKA